MSAIPFFLLPHYCSVHSHSKDAELGVFRAAVRRGGDAEADDLSGVRRVDDPVVPQPRRGVVRVPFPFVCLDDSRLETFLFFLRPLQQKHMIELRQRALHVINL